MNKNESSDAFAHFVMGRISTDIRKSLTAEQFNEIRTTISASSTGKEHTIDIRGFLPLFFARYYFVILVGRDKRSKTKFLEFNRRNEGNTIYSQVFLLVFIIPIIVITFLAVYALKSELGIDFFPNHHLSDFFSIIFPSFEFSDKVLMG